MYQSSLSLTVQYSSAALRARCFGPEKFSWRWVMQTGRLILCLSDIETVLSVRRLVLEQAGYRVLSATERRPSRERHFAHETGQAKDSNHAAFGGKRVARDPEC